MPDIDSAGAVKAAYKYLRQVSPNNERLGNFRVEEIQSDDQGFFILTLSYEVAGDFGFDKQKEYKEFKVKKEDGTIEWMKIKKV